MCAPLKKRYLKKEKHKKNSPSRRIRKAQNLKKNRYIDISFIFK